jgi:hypothetical protein
VQLNLRNLTLKVANSSRSAPFHFRLSERIMVMNRYINSLVRKFIKLIAISLLSLLAPFVVSANDYPTLERVDHVLTCMRLAGGQTVDNMYSCACEIDAIAQQVNFEDFTEARTYEIYKRMPGEKGGLFRESTRGDEITAKLVTAREDAQKRCFIGKSRKKASQNAASPKTPQS